LKRPSQKSLPSSLSKARRVLRNPPWKIPLFPLWKRGRKGDFTAFQKTKLFPYYYFIDPWSYISSIFIPGKTRMPKNCRGKIPISPF
jgi:hypothetical protein